MDTQWKPETAPRRGFSEGVNKPTTRMTSKENDFIHVHAKTHAKKKPLLAGQIKSKSLTTTPINP